MDKPLINGTVVIYKIKNKISFLEKINKIWTILNMAHTLSPLSSTPQHSSLEQELPESNT
jgi:hypothetical protein